MILRKTVSLSIYACKIIFIVEDDVSDTFRNLSKKFGFVTKEGTYAGGVLTGTMNTYYVLLGVKFLSHNTIAHEIYHLVCCIANDRLILEEEAKAWICGYASEILYKLLDKNKLQIKHG